MRELIGKIPTHDPKVTQNIYRCETVRCQKCLRTVPVGIEVVTVRIERQSQKVLLHEYYCRADAFDSHGQDYEDRIHNRPIHKPGSPRPRRF